ncbi:MAG: tetratricopeptide repeat protein [Gemmatimonadetes bacterium]|nr:tetratricopeptide repeat protein [Gemmatimonadota bacterium]
MMRRRGGGVPALVWVALGLIATIARPPHASSQDLTAARQALHEGRYADAERLAEAGGSAPAALGLRARILIETGRADATVRLLGGAAGPAPSPALERWLGEALLDRGRWDDAEAAFRRSETGAAADRLRARLRRGEVLLLRGRNDEAFELFNTFIDEYNSGRRLTADDLMAVGTAVSYLGRRTPVLFQDALKAFDEAVVLAPGDPRPLVSIGNLFLAKYNAPEAHAAFRQVLAANNRHPDALLGEARTLEFDGAPGTLTLANDAIATNPEHVGARIFLARQQLRSEDYDQAREEIDRALEANPNSLEALSVLAAVHFLTGDQAAYTRTRDRALALNPAYPDLFNTVAELAVDTRKYAEAVELARQAVERDSLSWWGWGILGTNQLRTGFLETGRANLERAFAGDPYNVWFKNSLDLLDTFDQYRIVETPHAEIMLHGSEADLLEPYVAAVAEEAYGALRERYGTEPPTPIRLELFPRSADFSVRTFGLVGLGALGVSFGSTLVMDSPSARDPGSFNWQSTLWHEMAHAYHLAMSDHNVPRWFSEGLAVREQRVARPYWGHRASPAWLQAYAAGQMPPVSQLNDAFVRPAFPEQVVLAYYQGSLVFDWIEEVWSFDVIRSFLTGYRDGRTTNDLARDLLGLSTDALDEGFDDYVRERFSTEFASTAGGLTPLDRVAGRTEAGGGDLPSLRAQARQRPGDFQARLRLGRALVEAENFDEAEPELREALRLFPGYGGPDGPLYQLARIHEARGETRMAADALRAAARLDESPYGALSREAELRRELGDDEGERIALARAVEIYPYGVAQHERLAELHTRAGDLEAAVIERRAVVGLGPADMAEARFQLALALQAAGRLDDARTQVLRALEIAPGYDAALELLLELRGGAG